MTTKVDQHSKADPNKDESFVREQFARHQRELEPKLIGEPAVGGPHHSTMTIYAGFAQYFRTWHTFHWYLVAAVDCVTAGYSAWGREGETVTFNVQGKPCSGPGAPLDHVGPPSMWRTGFFLALAMRRDDALKVLMDFPMSWLAQTPGDRDDFQYQSTETFRAFYRGDADWRAHAERTEQLLQPDIVSIATPKYAATIAALIPMMRAIDDRDQAAFTNATVAALKAHKAYWSRGKLGRGCDSLLAIPATGLAALGVDRGLRFEVDSGYAPAWLVNGEAPPPDGA